MFKVRFILETPNHKLSLSVQKIDVDVLFFIQESIKNGQLLAENALKRKNAIFEELGIKK